VGQWSPHRFGSDLSPETWAVLHRAMLSAVGRNMTIVADERRVYLGAVRALAFFLGDQGDELLHYQIPEATKESVLGSLEASLRRRYRSTQTSEFVQLKRYVSPQYELWADLLVRMCLAVIEVLERDFPHLYHPEATIIELPRP
jgi:hypothetical protein